VFLYFFCFFSEALGGVLEGLGNLGGGGG